MGSTCYAKDSAYRLSFTHTILSGAHSPHLANKETEAHSENYSDSRRAGLTAEPGFLIAVSYSSQRYLRK